MAPIVTTHRYHSAAPQHAPQPEYLQYLETWRRPLLSEASDASFPREAGEGTRIAKTSKTGDILHSNIYASSYWEFEYSQSLGRVGRSGGLTLAERDTKAQDVSRNSYRPPLIARQRVR